MMKPARKYWTEQEIVDLKRLYANTITSELCERFGATPSMIYNQAFRYGLKKSETYLKKHVHVMDVEIGKRTRFKPGQISHNKGQKMSRDLYKKCAPTMFKKGQLPHNTKRNGAISIRTDKNGTKRPFIRVAIGKWVEMKNHVWQQTNGPIPKGMCIALKDKNPFNYAIENLECITKRENMKRNTIHNYPEEIKTVIRTFSKLTKTIRKHGEE